MKPFIITAFLGLFCFAGHSQNLRIDKDCIDTISSTDFHFKLTGEAQFHDSIRLEIVITSNDSLHTVLFSGVKDFSDELNTTITNFVYDSATEAFHCDLINSNNTNYILDVISSINGAIKEEIVITLFVEH
jgi:hypothetical protein